MGFASEIRSINHSARAGNVDQPMDAIFDAASAYINGVFVSCKKVFVALHMAKHSINAAVTWFKIFLGSRSRIIAKR